MTKFALAARQFWLSTALAAGVLPLSAPPVRMATFDPKRMQGKGLIYLCLHGLPGQTHMYGDRFETAMSAAQVRSVDLTGSVVYLAGCYGAQMADAFMDAGADAVVGDKESTWAGTWLPLGSNRLGKLFVRELELGAEPGPAYDIATSTFARTSRDQRDMRILDSVAIRLGSRTGGS